MMTDIYDRFAGFIFFGGVDMIIMEKYGHIHIRLRKRGLCLPQDEMLFLPYAVAACTGEWFTIEYTDSAEDQAKALTDYLYQTEGVTI
jgi:hypothetical protein